MADKLSKAPKTSEIDELKKKFDVIVGLMLLYRHFIY